MLREVAVVGHQGGGEIGTVVSLPISTLFIMTHNAVELDFAFLKAKLYVCFSCFRIQSSRGDNCCRLSESEFNLCGRDPGRFHTDPIIIGGPSEN